MIIIANTLQPLRARTLLTLSRSARSARIKWALLPSRLLADNILYRLLKIRTVEGVQNPRMFYLCGQFVEQRLGFLQIGSVEAFSEPAINLRQHGARFVATVLVREQSRQAHRGPQFR
jgi:hypothetical protein